MGTAEQLDDFNKLIEWADLAENQMKTYDDLYVNIGWKNYIAITCNIRGKIYLEATGAEVEKDPGDKKFIECLKFYCELESEKDFAPFLFF